MDCVNKVEKVKLEPWAICIMHMMVKYMSETYKLHEVTTTWEANCIAMRVTPKTKNKQTQFSLTLSIQRLHSEKFKTGKHSWTKFHLCGNQLHKKQRAPKPRVRYSWLQNAWKFNVHRPSTCDQCNDAQELRDCVHGGSLHGEWLPNAGTCTPCRFCDDEKERHWLKAQV